MFFGRPSVLIERSFIILGVQKIITFIALLMIENLNTDDDVVGVKQLVLAIVAIVAILSLWSFLTTVHI
ncbi:hypothetical protein CNR22_01460 [Sphingobacteriaceae bacterium]|nr:hypothetical protein CNR22_01460 [Sphingobacteriaceae bacterium]